MKSPAILTKFIPATICRNDRFKAICLRGSLTLDADPEISPEQNHIAVAEALKWKFVKEDTLDTDPAQTEFGAFNLPPKISEWGRVTVCGALPDGTYAHVFVSAEALGAAAHY